MKDRGGCWRCFARAMIASSMSLSRLYNNDEEVCEALSHVSVGGDGGCDMNNRVLLLLTLIKLICILLANKWIGYRTTLIEEGHPLFTPFSSYAAMTQFSLDFP
jgi:hypothetical protein